MDSSREGFPRHPWDLVIACVAGALLLVLAALTVALVVPPALANLGAEVSDGATEAPIGDGGATVVTPAGWVVTGAASDAVTVRTPDGALTVHLRATDAEPSAALDAAAAAAQGAGGGGERGPTRTEELAAGGTVTHADVGSRALAAVVAYAGVVEVVAVVPEGVGLDAYRPALGALLEGIRP